PLLSDTMKEGKIVAWYKKVGDPVKSDDVLAEVETDKATMEVLPYVDGTLLYIGVEADKAAKINEIITIIGKEGTDITTLLNDDGNEQSNVDNSNSQQQPNVASKTEDSSSNN